LCVGGVNFSSETEAPQISKIGSSLRMRGGVESAPIKVQKQFIL
jgi:hypothetical protein